MNATLHSDKRIGAGLVTTGLVGARAGAGLVFGSFGHGLSS